MLHQTSFTVPQVAKLDRTIFQQQDLFLKISQYAEVWKPKNHYAQHFPVDIIRYGPPIYWSERKFEMRHQWLKRRAKMSNFKNMLKAITTDMEMRTALYFMEGQNS